MLLVLMKPASNYNYCFIFQFSGYTGKKFEDNLNCEIFGTIHEEAVDSYKKEIVHELSSNSPEEMESNLERIVQWVEQWKQNKS